MWKLQPFILMVFAFPISSFAIGDEVLPRVLIIGDRLYQQPANEVAKELKGRAEVVYGTLDAGVVVNSESILGNFDKLVGDRKWDVIHFNAGLGDLVYRVPKVTSFRVLPKSAGGVRATTPQSYERNLKELVKRLQETDAKLVWASTTPIRASTTGVFDLESEIQYNAIAARIMRDHKIPTNDMYAFVKDLIDMTRPASHGADPFHFDKKPIHEPIVKVILASLDADDETGTSP